MSKLTDVNLSILADTDCPSDWEREDLLEFAQEAAREILNARTIVKAARTMIAVHRPTEDDMRRMPELKTLVEALDAYYGEKIV
jgi:DNA-binding FadR family transcriptional regulator